MCTELQTISSEKAHGPRDLPGLNGKRIVICEDEGLTLMQLRRDLTHAGMSVVGAVTNGQDGVEAVLKERPDMVLMDVAMPVMDGLEASRRILSVYRPCLVMLTGYADLELRTEATALGVSGFVNKPVTSDTLLPALVDALVHDYKKKGTWA